MPTKRTLRKRKRQPEGVLTPAIRIALEAGSDLVCAFDHLSPAAVQAELDKLWKIHGPEVLADYIEKFPTQRPDLWWRHDSPVRRPQLEHEDDGTNFELFDRARKQQRIKEVEILVRHGLLTAAEKRAFEMPGG
jgi:hypothetical protein